MDLQGGVLLDHINNMFFVFQGLAFSILQHFLFIPSRWDIFFLSDMYSHSKKRKSTLFHLYSFYL